VIWTPNEEPPQRLLAGTVPDPNSIPLPDLDKRSIKTKHGCRHAVL